MTTVVTDAIAGEADYVDSGSDTDVEESAAASFRGSLRRQCKSKSCSSIRQM